jgi:hypothetical protein
MSMTNDELVEVIEREAETSPVKADGDASPHGDYKVWVHGQESRDNYRKILNALPAIIKDQLAMTELLDRLLGVVAEQQIEIARLSSKIEAVTKASIEVKTQENMNDIVAELADKGCDISNAEVDIKLEGSSSYVTEDREDRLERSSENEAYETNVTGGIEIILNQLGGLSFGYDRKASEAQRKYKKLTLLRNRDVKSRYEGHMRIKFGKVTGAKKSKSWLRK